MKTTIALALLLGLSAAAPASPGYITVQQEEGRWWFVDGQGKKFFFLGPNCVSGCYGHYEKEPLPAWRKDQAVKVLKDWGFNALGNWSSPSLWNDFPFVDQLYHGMNDFRDYFDTSAWLPGLKKALAKEMEVFIGHKNLVGYFLDNEPGWKHDALWDFYRKMPAKSAGAKAFIAFVKERHKGDLKALNKAWGSKLKSFNELLGKKPISEKKSKQDRLAWKALCAGKFYEVVAREVRAIDPHHLIVGIRHAGIPTVEFSEAVDKHMDVISINNYNRFGNLEPSYAEIHKATGKPIMITEWSFSGYPATGKKSLQYIEVYSQQDKGKGYMKFTRQMAEAPFMVGSHWFLYVDYEPGNFMQGPYYPDQNMGMLSSDERTVYHEFGDWARRTNAQVEEWHAKSAWNPSPTPTPEAVAFPALSPKVDGDLSDWPAELARVPRVGRSLHEGVEVKDKYYFAADAKNLYVAAEIWDNSVDAIEPAWNWECDYLGVTLEEEGNQDEFARTYVALLPAGGGNPAGLGPQAYVQCWSCKAYGPLKTAKIARKYLWDQFGYTMEAAIPLKDLAAWDSKAKTWKLALFYHNNSGVYETSWSGLASRGGKR